MPPLVDLAGERFGRLRALERDTEPAGSGVFWWCVCDCGVVLSVRRHSLRSGNTQSCGCRKSDLTRERNRITKRGNENGLKHGHARRGHMTPTFVTWLAMTQRCTDSGHHKWADYGGRGITVCEQWRSFEGFLADMGERPEGRTLDRIDNDGNYEPRNCRWATAKEQRANQRPRKRS